MWYIKKYGVGKIYFLSKDNKWKPKARGRNKNRLIVWRQSLLCFETSLEGHNYIKENSYLFSLKTWNNVRVCNGLVD